MKGCVSVLIAVLMSCSYTATVRAQGSDPSAEEQAYFAHMLEVDASLTRQHGVASVGAGLARMNVPAEYDYLGPDDARRVLEAWGNPPDDTVLGMLIPAGASTMFAWGVVISFEPVGYVEDDDAEDIDYDEVLQELQADTRAANPEREAAGYGTVEIVGWAEPPSYNRSLHALYWAKDLVFDGDADHTLNYDVRLLGRRGVLCMSAVSNIDDLATIRSAMSAIMAFTEYERGHRYVDFDPGVDTVAAVGLGALVAGKLMAKTGILKGLLLALVAAKKFVVMGAVAVGAWFRSVFRRGRDEDPT